MRRCCYDLLRLLLHREELGCTLFASAEAGLLDTPTLLRWRALQESTVAWVVETVGDPPAGGDGPALRLVAVSLVISVAALVLSEWLARRAVRA